MNRLNNIIKKIINYFRKRIMIISGVTISGSNFNDPTPTNLIAIFGDSVSTYGGLILPQGANPSVEASYILDQTGNILSRIQLLYPSYTVVNISRGGMTTDEALTGVQNYIGPGPNPFESAVTITGWINKNRPEKIVLRYGLADAVLIRNSSITLNNIQTIIDYAQSLGIEVILLGVNPTATDGSPESCGYFNPSFTSEMATAALAINNGIISKATNQGLKFANPRKLTVPICGLPDGIHPFLPFGINITKEIYNQLKYKFVLPTANITANEGNTVVFTVNTLNVPDGTLIPWAAISDTGATVQDISYPVPVLGNVTIISNTGNISITIATDSISPETGESFYVNLYETQADRNNFANSVASSSTVSIINVP